MAKMEHGPISTPESFNKESDRLGWSVRLIRGLVGPLIGGAHQEGWVLVKRDTGEWVLACEDPQLATACAVWHVEHRT